MAVTEAWCGSSGAVAPRIMTAGNRSDRWRDEMTDEANDIQPLGSNTLRGDAHAPTVSVRCSRYARKTTRSGGHASSRKELSGGILGGNAGHCGSIEPLQFFGDNSMTELSPGRKRAVRAFIIALFSTRLKTEIQGERPMMKYPES